ncbi:MAG: carbohydrate-binding protein [Gorillibacterium sp.]|nr:carbohydrate-binding protein [Gorillibacterium sp.]
MGANPQYVLDAADEQGMLIIDEFMYGSIGGLANQEPALLANVKEYTSKHMLLDRNHPSIIMWNASNEVVGYGSSGFGPLSLSQMLDLISYMGTIDNTKPINTDGENSAPDVNNLHYTPGGYGSDWPTNNNVYGSMTVPNNTKMWGIGEFLGSYLINSGHSYKETMAMQGLYSRAARYYGYADIRPYRLDWTWQELPDRRLQADTVAKSFAPVAVFDHAYDNAGVNPILLASGYPSYATSANITRTLDVYNDELSNTSVTLKWFANFNGSTIASGSPALTIPLGQHGSQNISFAAPALSGKLELVMESWKGGVLKFRDTRYFTIGTGTDNIAPRQIADLSASYPTENTVVLNWTAPGNDNDKGTAVSYDIRYSTSAITDANWGAATQISSEVTPDQALTPQEMEIGGLNAGTTYYIAMKASDGIVTSMLSNVAGIATKAANSTSALVSIADKSTRGDAANQLNGDLYVKPNLFTNGIADDTVNNSMGYLKFDVSGFSSTDRAILKLNHKQSTNPGAWTMFVYGLDHTSWNDSSNFASPIPGVNKGVGITSGDSGAQFVAAEPITPGTVGKYVTIDVTDYVISKKQQGASQIAFILYGNPFESETLGSTFSGREISDQQPKLVVNGTVVQATPNKYEAESAVLTGGASMAIDHTGYSGTGFVAGYFNTMGASTTFTVNADTAGSKLITLRYSAGSGTSTNTGLYVNGTKLKNVTVAGTANWDTWVNQVEVANLNSGVNTIEFRADSSSPQSINLDYITVEPSRLEAENASLSGGTVVESDHTGYSGSSFVGGYYNNVGATTTFNVSNSAGGNYTVSLRYANASGSTQQLSLYVNGVKIKQIALANLANWDTWSTQTETISLNAGNNTIAYKRDSTDSSVVNLDCIDLTQ